MDSELKQLAKTRDGCLVYDAGLPHYPRNFTRDAVLAAWLRRDATMMAAQARFCRRHQGRVNDPHSGEEPGKIFHEYPGYPQRGKSTQYNGCDTTGLWLFGMGLYVDWTGDARLLDECRPAIDAALGYVRRHLNDRHEFMEDPAFCGADRFGLKVTYWKDSVLVDRPAGTTVWPAVFPLAHVQTLAGVRAIGRLLDDAAAQELAAQMLTALPRFFHAASGTFYPAIDGLGPVHVLNSDGLHALAYLEVGDLAASLVAGLARAAPALATQYGYRTMAPGAADRAADDYHAKTVWPFEQALIHLGARRFGLDDVAAVCERVIPHIQTSAPETLAAAGNLDSPSCDPQLWTLAARSYFQRIMGPGTARAAAGV